MCAAIVCPTDIVTGPRLDRLGGYSVIPKSLRSASCSNFSRSALALLIVPALSVAQGVEDAQPEELVVTGSRIRGVEVVGSTSISLGRELIDAVPAITTSDLMRNVPQVINLGADETHRGVQGGQGNTTFSSGVNLRGIGGNTTLLLFDGRRMPPQGGRGVYFDPNLIPTLAIERVEVVPDGASAIYGSDAIAGVVNLIPRKDFVGAEVRAQYGFADDYEKHSIAALGGFDWDWLGGGNLVAAAERSGHPNLRGEDRDFFTSDLRARGGRDFRTNLCNPGTIVVGGTNYAIPAGQNGTNLDPASLVAGTVNMCDDAKNTDLIPDQERTSVMLNVRQRFTDAVEVFTQGYYSERDFSIRGMLRNSVSRASVTVPQSNPYFVSPVPGATSVLVNYRLPEEFGISFQDGFDRTYQITTGATIDLPAEWKVGATIGYGRNQNLFRDNNLIDTRMLDAALRSSDPATALNPFGDGASSPASVYESFRTFTTNFGYNTRKTGSIDADGPLFGLPGGDVRLAVGYDHVDDLHTGRQRTTAGTITPRSMGREIDSVYGELFVPIFGDANSAAGLRRLDLSLAVRYDDYSDVGGTTNPKYGLTWAPIDGLQFKASYGTSFRAPTLGDLLPDTVIYQRQLVDPLSPTNQSTGLLYSGGNPNLKPESATTRSFGIEFAPEVLPGARMSLNYFDVEYRDQTLSLYGLASTLLQNPYYNRYIQRNPTPAEIDTFLQGGRVNGAINPSVIEFLGYSQTQNLAITVAKGVDYQFSYEWHTDMGEFTAGLYGTEYTEFLTAPAAGAPPVDVRNTIDNPPQTRLRFDLGWRNGPWSASTRLTHIGSYDNNLITPTERVSSSQIIDLHVDYRFEATEGLFSDLTVAFDVENVLDTEPNFVNQVGGFDAQVASAIGRMVSFSVRKSW